MAFELDVVSDDLLTRNRLARAQRGDEEAFAELTGPYRPELQLHCYRILGSLQDAEDLLQDTMLAAWRGLEQFEGRSSLRAWLYTIATNRCLNALRDARRRPQLTTATDAPGLAEIPWLSPYPEFVVFEEVVRVRGLAVGACRDEAPWAAPDLLALT
jgi:DNA-directed RNA polymerase specialized sigma24 family protein